MKWDAQYPKKLENKLSVPLNVDDRTDTEMDYTGWYRSALGARYYANSVIGSKKKICTIQEMVQD